MARKASKLKTPLAVLKSNERYREGFIQKAIRFDRIEDFDLLQAIEADKIASFNATIINLLRKKYKLDGKAYRAEQAEKIEAMKENTVVQSLFVGTKTIKLLKKILTSSMSI